MSGKFGGGSKVCTFCSKKSYAGETLYYEKQPYHVNCFRCTTCNKKITLSQAKKHEGKLYDERCYNRAGYNHLVTKVKWTKKEVDPEAKSSGGSQKYGGGGTPCDTCKKTVFTAEAVSFEKKVFHQKCFECHDCHLALKASNAAAYEGVIYCRKCFAKGGYSNKQAKSAKNWKSTGGGSGGTTGGGGSGRYGGGGERCATCTKTVYTAEKVVFEKKIYHANCFRCKKCKKKKNTGDAAKYDNPETKEREIYCKKCFAEEGLARKQASVGKWVPRANTGTTTASGKYGGGGSKCTNCGKTCYLAEAIQFEKKPYHPNCFVCAHCKGKCKAVNTNQFEDNIYCKKCWVDQGFKAKQAKTAQNWKKSETKSTGGSSKFGGGGQKCTTCAKTVYTAEAASFEKHVYHQKCLICTDCNTKTAIKNLNMFEEQLKCGKCWQQNNYKAKQVAASKAAFEAKKAEQKDSDSSGATDSRFKNFGGGGTKCVACDKVVYPGEAITFEKQSYHAKCFTCANTEAHPDPLKLTSSSANYKKDSNGFATVYCQGCFTSLGLNRATLD